MKNQKWIKKIILPALLVGGVGMLGILGHDALVNDQQQRVKAVISDIDHLYKVTAAAKETCYDRTQTGPYAWQGYDTCTDSVKASEFQEALDNLNKQLTERESELAEIRKGLILFYK
jgi:hypothetical protein